MALLLTILIPLATTLILAILPANNPRAHRIVAFIGSLAAFAASIVVWMGFNPASAAFQFVTDVPWISSIDVGFRFGIDGMSLLLVTLTTLILPIAIASSWESIRDREKMYYIMLMLLEFGVLGVFTALDTFLFYVFWEIVLIPMYFLIGIWGGKDRIYASMKFFIYTMAGSLLMLVAIIWLGFYAETHGGAFTADLRKLIAIAPSVPLDPQQWLFLAFALSFCIKVPLFPLHTWLPDAHTQAPTAGSVILAAVMLKMGTYGLVRFNLQLFPQASLHYADVIAVLSVIGIIYGALVAMVQTDIKKLVAYSSVAHLGFVTLGIFSLTAEGVQGAVLQMVNHGLSTGMLFLLVGFLYERRHTREMSEFGGIAKSMPVYAVFFAFAMLASVGLPGLNGFVGEYLTLVGAFMSRHLATKWYAIIGASGVILAAVYLLILYQRIFFGPLVKAENARLKDLTKLEVAMCVPLVVFFIWIGFQPNMFLRVSESSTRATVGVIEALRGETRYAADVRARSGDTTTIVPTQTIAPPPPGAPPGMQIQPGGTPVQVGP
ncbi:MAG: NADH-quinone oxidoreductase subunit M [bacterium]|nr:NADH-quinone oxidoreductase subunit M [Candidatus Kapabacteria bacterium]